VSRASSRAGSASPTLTLRSPRDHREVTFEPGLHTPERDKPSQHHHGPAGGERERGGGGGGRKEGGNQGPADVATSHSNSISSSSKLWLQPEAVRRLFLDRAQGVARYYAHFPVEEAVRVTEHAVEGDAAALLDFQRAESLAFVGAYDSAVVEHLFEVFDVDCDNVLSRAEGEKLLLAWLRDAQVHLLAVLHSLVAGLVACKISTALALACDPRADSWGGADTSSAGFAFDEDVEWVRNAAGVQGRGSKNALQLRAQERGEMKASLVLSRFGSRLGPMLASLQPPARVSELYDTVLAPLERDVDPAGMEGDGVGGGGGRGGRVRVRGVPKSLFVEGFCDHLEGSSVGSNAVLAYLLKG